jgi:aminoglycoside/choline kinase family phosphotransferase
MSAARTGTPGAVQRVLTRRPEELTPEWLTAVLSGSDLLDEGSSIDSFSLESVGTGQMADTVRIAYRTVQGDTRSVVAKFASADEQSRSTGLLTRAYEIEVGFYGEVADRIRTRMPRCYYRQCDPDTGWFVLLLEDLAGALQGDQLAGCDTEVAASALTEMARLHGPAWGQADLAEVEWLQHGGTEADEFMAGLVTSLWPGFVDRYRARLDRDHLALCDRFMAALLPWLIERPPPTTVTHGDFRLDNLLFRPDDPRPFVVDWQTATWGAAASDAAYFLGASLTTEDRRRHGEGLVDGYHEALLSEGVTGFDRDRLDDEYRRLCFGGLVMSIGASMLVKRTERGDEMFVTSVARYAQQALDLDAEATLPGPTGR